MYFLLLYKTPAHKQLIKNSGMLGAYNEELETHLNTCEVYICTVCDTKAKEIEAIIQHMEKKTFRSKFNLN